MASASDIITYIGVPLAVLGVLPILYTFVLTVFTRRRIHKLLVHHGHKPLNSTRHHDGFSIRSSPMTTLIEVELPRYTIAPLERNSTDYWQNTNQGQSRDGEDHALLERAESTLSMVEEGRVQGFLRGGSWRAFHWRRLVVGKKLYRIQYDDELREPAAEIDFADLIHFLLDWGAVPDAMGWEKLKSGGLWTPAGTILLRKADALDDASKKHVDWVLRTAMPDESDGVLSLTIKWSKDMESVSESRGAASLPPGWGRLTQPSLLEHSDSDGAAERHQDLPRRIDTLKIANKHSLDSSSFRFHSSDNLIKQVHWENTGVETGSVSEPDFSRQVTNSVWFTAATASLLTHSSAANNSLWSYTLPKDISSVALKSSIPCGILVLLSILDETAVPQWATNHTGAPHRSNPGQVHHARFLARLEAERLEVTMPAEQARVHRLNRQNEEHRQRTADVMAQIAERKENEEKRKTDALASPKITNQAVAEACLAWLIQQGEIGRDWTVEQLAEAVLYLMVVDNRQDGSEAKKIFEVLDEWTNWNNAGGIQRHHIGFLEERKLEFCFAASLMAVVQKSEATGHGKANSDMMECLGMWRKVRLG